MMWVVAIIYNGTSGEKLKDIDLVGPFETEEAAKRYVMYIHTKTKHFAQIKTVTKDGTYNPIEEGTK